MLAIGSDPTVVHLFSKANAYRKGAAMTLHTNIGDEFFPVDVADPNQLTTYYESYVLIPHLGPLLYSRLFRRLKRIINDFSSSWAIVDDIKFYATTYKEIPPTPYVPDDIVVSGYAISEGAAKSGFKIDEAYARPNNRQPQSVLNALNQIGTDVIQSAPAAKFYTADDGRMDQYKQILSGMAQTNAVISSMVDQKLLLGTESIASKRFLNSNPERRVKMMVDSYMKTAPSVKIPKVVSSYSESMTMTLLQTDPQLSVYWSSFVDLVSVAVANFLDQYSIVDPADHITVVESCEWAFLRLERVILELGRPLFRGPLEVNSVAPNSELTLTETESRTITTGSRTLALSRDDLTDFNSIASEVKNKMGILFDYGSNLGETMSEQGFSQDNMKSEKRSRVESALREISQQNSTMTVSTQTLSTSEIREYHTEGKDPKFATSELSFEVFSPLAVKHYLEDVTAVWCPRVNNPFARLRTSLLEYYNKMYGDYILENYVIDPMEPIPSYNDLNRVTRETEKATSPGTYTRTVTFKLTDREIESGQVFGDDIKLEFHQHDEWFENSYDQDDYWMKIIQTDRHAGNDWVNVTVKYHVDNVAGNDPDRTWLSVSIDKYQETEAYRQELSNYQQTVTKTNPARREAIKAQARKYASLKRDELIRKYDQNIEDLKDYAFTSLIKKMFANNVVDENWSYYLGIIRSCIDWGKSRVDPEPCDIDELYENVLSPYHFLNVQAVRFFLPLNVGAETIFFDTMRKVVDQSWQSLFSTVEDYIRDQREEFNGLPEEGRFLDSYDSELVLGRHLEAVLSNKTFSE